jgi:hypothetical protein
VQIAGPVKQEHQMTDNKSKADPQAQPTDEQDVEGHMMINPTPGGDMARVRSKDIDRAVRERNRAKEAKR